MWIPNPGLVAEIVGYQDEMAQRYIANALARAGARKERDNSEAEEDAGEGAGPQDSYHLFGWEEVHQIEGRGGAVVPRTKDRPDL